MRSYMGKVIGVLLGGGMAASMAAPPEGGDTQLDEVTVRGEAPALIAPPPDRRPNTVTAVGQEGIRVLGGPAQSNPWMALQMAPSVNLQSADPYGLGNRLSMRVRGKSSTHVGRTVNGLPIAGEPGFASGKGGGDLFDLENMSGISLLRGAVPAGSGLGFSNSSVVDMTLRGPEEKFGIDVSQAFGTENFRRTYVRVDSGTLSAPVRFFVSASDMSSDKWRGPGDQNRTNLEFGVRADINERLSVELNGVHHKVRWNDYRALSYAQVQDPAAYRSVEFSEQLTGKPAADYLYHGFNRQDFTDNALLGKVSYATGADSLWVFKPYYWKETGYSLSGSANAQGAPGVTWWEIVHDTYGFDLRHESKHTWGEVVVGYWYQSSEAPPPPTSQRLYRIQPDGSLAFAQWSTLARTTRHVYNNPYVSVTTRVGQADLTAGLRYMSYRDPSFQYYQGKSAPDVPYGAVFGYQPTPDPGMVSQGRTFHQWLPNLGFAYPLAGNAHLRGSYGRTYGRQNWGSVASAFTSSRAAFDAAGLRFNDIWYKLQPEISDNFDLGARLDIGNAYIAPTFFHTRYKDKQLSLYDPVVGVAYHQSVAKAHANGLELEVGIAPRPTLDIYASYTFNRAVYDEDARTASTTVVNVQGKQMQDSPRHMLKAGMVWRWGGWSFMPSVRYIGKRFGDTEEKQAVDGYAVADLGIAYRTRNVLGFKQMDVDLNISNLFDKRYIGIINTSDYAVGGLPTYLPGTPRALAVKVSAKF